MSLYSVKDMKVSIKWQTDQLEILWMSCALFYAYFHKIQPDLVSGFVGLNSGVFGWKPSLTSELEEVDSLTEIENSKRNNIYFFIQPYNLYTK